METVDCGSFISGLSNQMCGARHVELQHDWWLHAMQATGETDVSSEERW